VTSPETSAEFIEIANLDSTAHSLAGWKIYDEGGSSADLPALSLGAGEVAIIVGSSYQTVMEDFCSMTGGVTPCDADPVPGTVMLVLSTSSVLGGVVNSGERYSLRNELDYEISTYGNWVTPASGIGIERIDPYGDDVASNWRRNTSGTSTPGVVAGL